MAASAVDLADPDLPRLILRLALPSVIGLSINALHHVANAAFVGLLGPPAVAAMSVVFPLVVLLAAIGEGIGIGAASCISRALGAGKVSLASRAAGMGFLTAAVLGVPATVLLLAGLDPLLTAFGASVSTLPLARGYGGLIIAGYTTMMCHILCDLVAIAEGRTRFSMLVLLISFAVNIALDPVFIFLFDWGVTGAAVATLAGQAVALGIYGWDFAQRRGTLRIGLRLLRPVPALLREIAAVGLPASLASVLSAVAFALIYRAAGAHGDAAVAGVGIALRLLTGGSLPVIGFCLGAQPIFGFGWGAGAYARLLRAIQLTVVFASLFTGGFAGLMLAFSHEVVALFTTDAGVRGVAARALMAFTIGFALFGVQMVLVTLLQATGRARLAAFLSLAPQGLVLIPALLILPRRFGLDGLLASQVLASGLTSVLVVVVMTRMVGELRRRAAEDCLARAGSPARSPDDERMLDPGRFPAAP
ncbi:MATE family efflux transporter [Microvirga sp. VF16]|uniref:MATE family efflux transporter n=1 Tax=Microvirga sp. VF16 TaxID=2807101 RepID=UPI00193CB5D0|nr:MATE family efflux transporter [Microvirga sp. VF16]QRM32610.1 MATE family efflux transporter [Microvirga sp. VF16]